MGLEEHVERLRAALIKRMGGKAYLRPQKLVETLATDLSESALTIRQCMARLAKEGWLDGVSSDGSPFRQVKIIGHVPVEPPDPNLLRWISVLGSSELSEHEQDVLKPLSAKLSAFSDSEMGFILNGLLQLRANLHAESGRHRFLVSAQYLMGSSKLLDELSSTALRSFGIPIDVFPSHPLYVVVAGCPSPKVVVLVENPAAFEMAVSTKAVNQCAFVATFGFGLSKSQEDYGNQLACMVEERFADAITLTREGSTCPSARELLNHPRIMFWGDLDVAGIQIFLRLRKSIPALRLSALYQPMVTSLRVPEYSHPYIAAVGKDGQNKMSITCVNGDQTVQGLLNLCASRGVDQEHIKKLQIETLASLELVVDKSSTPDVVRTNG